MMSLGDPTLILNYCREYWDGSTCSIAPLSAVDRLEVLNVYERWKLEDFDVVAFCYSPMPVSSLVYFQDGCTKEEGENGRTLYFVDPTPVEKLTGKKLKKEVKIDEKHEKAGLPVAESGAAETQSQAKGEAEVINLLHHSVSVGNLEVIMEEDSTKDPDLHESSGMIWKGASNTEVSLPMRSMALAIKKSASDSNLATNYPLDSDDAGLQLNWSIKSLNASGSELLTPTITKESLITPNTLAKGYLDLDGDSSTMSDPPLTSRPFLKKAFTEFECMFHLCIYYY
ncbi:hypothetical protein EON65_18105 [archaeon]|nr:MAG: hypothetical protein EON65_18105 [archaeon]